MPRAGALDQPALQAGNRLVGNEPDTTTNAAHPAHPAHRRPEAPHA
ncbi:hypothetical protein ACFVVL_33190 [Kitasatospora sp. NPDC058115]